MFSKILLCRDSIAHSTRLGTVTFLQRKLFKDVRVAVEAVVIALCISYKSNEHTDRTHQTTRFQARYHRYLFKKIILAHPESF